MTRLLALSCCLLAAACRNGDGSAAAAALETAAARPREIAAPDSALLVSAGKQADSLPRIRSLVVAWKGRAVLERYYHGASRATPANIKSASKSVMSAVVGIAIARGDIGSPYRTIGELLPAESRALDTAKRAITVEDLLTMRSGLQSTSFENYGAWVSSRNWVADALRRPVVAPRGAAGPMIYSTGSSHLLSAVVSRATRMSTHAYADRHLFRPMGFRLRGWTTDPQGIHFGGNEMRLTPLEMLAFGELYRNRGTVTRGDSIVRILPEAWIDSSWVPRTSSTWSGNEYGYGWWMFDRLGYRAWFAWGYGGQYIFVIPDLSATIVVTSDPNSRSGEDGHRSRLFAIIRQTIVPALGG